MTLNKLNKTLLGRGYGKVRQLYPNAENKATRGRE